MKRDDRSDEQLHDALRGGDTDAGASLYDRYFARVRGFFINKVVEPASWDDLTQQTFEVVLFKADKFRGESSFRSYLFGVAHMILRADYRRRRTDAARSGGDDVEELGVADMGPGVSTLTAERAEAQRLIFALRRIPIKYQSVFEMYYWQDLSAGEIARICGCPIGTVRGRLRLAKQALLDQLGLQRDNFGELLRGFRDIGQWAHEVQTQIAATSDEP